MQTRGQKLISPETAQAAEVFCQNVSQERRTSCQEKAQEQVTISDSGGIVIQRWAQRAFEGMYTVNPVVQTLSLRRWLHLHGDSRFIRHLTPPFSLDGVEQSWCHLTGEKSTLAGLFKGIIMLGTWPDDSKTGQSWDSDSPNFRRISVPPREKESAGLWA